jgi:cell wall assembly regulator SMI1
VNSKLQHEVRRLERIFARADIPLAIQRGASPQEIAAVEKRTGIVFSEDLKTLWQLSDGSGHQRWFTDGDDPDEFLGESFLSLAVGLKWWALFEPYDEAIYRRWHYDGSWGPRDTRIQPTFLHHRLWFPLSQNAGSDYLQFDADPTTMGSYGQIIKCCQDPYQVDFVAKSFVEFFRKSNDVLEKCVEGNPSNFREMIEL